MHKIQHYDHDEQIGGISWKQLFRLTSQALERRNLCQILKQKGTQIEMQDFNKAFTQQRNAISAPGLKHGSVMKSNNTHPPPCPPFHILRDKHQWEPFQHHLVQSSPAAENKPGFNLPAADHFNLKVSCVLFIFYAIWTRNTIVLSQKNTLL